jgi:monoterpene epsilon-lactone hydrolase
MSEQQRQTLDAILRQGSFEPGGEVTELRASFEALMAQVPISGDVEQKPTTVGGVDGIEVAIAGESSDNVILYFHGGVYVIGSAKTSVGLVSDLARRTGAGAITVDYRLGPESPYPAAVEDAQAAYDGLLAQGIDPGRIALAGESAGGGLAVAALMALRNSGRPMPACAYLMSPYADLSLSGETLSEKQDVDPILSPASLQARVPDYVAGGNAKDPLISPVFGDLSGLPPLLIQSGSHEVLLSDSIRLAGRAAIADVPVVLEVTPGVPHVFQAYAAILDEGSAALDSAAAFLNAQFAGA